MRRLGLLAYLLAAAVVILDQATKYWVLNVIHLADRGQMAVVWPVQLSFVQNQGVSFGLFRGEAEWTRWALAAFSLVVSLGLAVWARRIDRPLLALSVGLVMGGAVGNLIDRVRFGWVVDFVDVTALHFPWVFNVADSGITVGIALLLLDSMLAPKKPVAT